MPLPVHPFTGLTALGLRRNGDPIWPILGGADDASTDGDSDGDDADENADDGEDDSGDDADPEGADKLADPGKRALDAMKARVRAARAQAKSWDKLAQRYGVKTPDELAAKLAKPAENGDAPAEADVEALRTQIRAELAEETMSERVADKIEARAAKFTNPAHARAILLSDRDADEFVSDGKVDVEAITEALDELLESNPNLAAAGNGSRAVGSADGGPRKAAPKRAASLSEAIDKHYDAAGKK